MHPKRTSVSSHNSNAALVRAQNRLEIENKLNASVERLTHFATESTPPAARDQFAAVTAHLARLAANLISKGDRTLRTRQVARDLRMTLKWATSAAFVLEILLEELTTNSSEKAMVSRWPGARLLVGEVGQAAEYLLARAQHLGVKVNADLQPGGAVHPFLPVVHGVSPFELTPTDLLPPTTNLEPQREATLLSALVEGNVHEQHAAALLLWITARDRLMAAPVVPALDFVGFNLLAAQDLRQEERRPSELPKALRLIATQLRSEFDNIKVAGLRPQAVVPKAERPTLLADSLALLRDFRAFHLEGTGVREEQVDESLWYSFGLLDKALVEGKTPENEPLLRSNLLLHCVYALVRLPRAPGMPLTVTAELAAQMSDVDPLWGWKECSNNPVAAEVLGAVLGYMLRLHSYADLPGEHANVDHVATLLIRHLYTSLRELQLRLPQLDELRDLLQPPGTQQISKLTETEAEEVEHEIMRLSLLVSESKLRSGAADPPSFVEELLETEETQTLYQTPELPKHLQEARALLRGKRVTLLGSRRREQQHAALMDMLELEDLDWISADEYQHGLHAGNRVRSDTDLVILAVRWMGHAHNGLRDIARSRGVPCVMHTGGFSPSSVGYSVMRQVGFQLTSD